MTASRMGPKAPSIIVGLLMSFMLISTASAERPPSKSERAKIEQLEAPELRGIGDHITKIEVSTKGPYALVLSAGGQPSADVVKRTGSRWHYVATISDEGLACSVPAAVVADLHLERYNEGPRPCTPGLG